jgi:hypothetical protein
MGKIFRDLFYKIDLVQEMNTGPGVAGCFEDSPGEGMI